VCSLCSVRANAASSASSHFITARRPASGIAVASSSVCKFTANSEGGTVEIGEINHCRLAADDRDPQRSAFREGREHKLQASSAIVLGYLCGASLCYFTTSAAGKFVGPYTVVGAYLLFLPLAFISAAISGWILSRTHSRPMVLVFAMFCVIASVVAFAVYVLFPIDRMPLPMTVVVLTVDFIIAPIGVLAGGLFGAARVESHGTYRSI
jgi:hypothetical protein